MSNNGSGSLVGRALKDFFSCQGAENGALIAKINPILQKRAWTLFKEEGGNFSGYSLIRDWNAATGDSAFCEDGVDKYIAAHSTYNGSMRQKFIATAVKYVLCRMPPSQNCNSELNSKLVNVGWKLLDANPKLSEQEFSARLLELAKTSLKKPDGVKFKQPSGVKIPGQGEVGILAAQVVKQLKAEKCAPSENGKIPTKVAGIINAVVWKFVKADNGDINKIWQFIKGETPAELKAKIADM